MLSDDILRGRLAEIRALATGHMAMAVAQPDCALAYGMLVARYDQEAERIAAELTRRAAKEAT